MEQQELNKYQKGEVLLIDKPYEWTSFDVVNKTRNLIRRKYDLKKLKVGHAGTLDPLATGLVILCTGRMTKQIETFQAQEKEYVAEFCIGAVTPSFDLETEVEQRFPTDHITDELIYETAKGFVRKQEQVPPVYSAKRINGERAYNAARKGREIKMRVQNIEIFEFEIQNINLPVIQARIRCSKGTYIRSLANDFGKKLDSGAYLQNLRRTKIGEYSVDNAISVDKLPEIL